MTATPAPWTVSELLRTRRALRALALRLVAEGDAADDVVQDAFLALASRGESPSLPQRWLTRVTRNLALRWRRDVARRKRAEDAGARDATAGDAATLAVQVELQRNLADAVLALSEPYRSTLLQRFWEGKTPTAIASATGTPVATVKARLQRGLGQVRASLDRRYGDRAAWRAAVLPMLRVGGTLAMAAWSAPTAWVIAGVGATVVGLAVSFAVNVGHAPVQDQVAASPLDQPTGEPRPLVPAADSTAHNAAPTRVPIAPASEGMVVDVKQADGTPVADIGVGLRGLYYDRNGGAWHESYRSLGRTDARGQLRLGLAHMNAMAEDGWWTKSLGDPHVRVYIDEPGLIDVASEPFTRARLERAQVALTLPATGRLRVVATDALGRPFVPTDRHVQVNQTEPGRKETREDPRRAWSSSTKFDDSGTVVFPFVGLGKALSLSGSLTHSSTCGPLTRDGEELTVRLGETPGAVICTGRLLDNAGRPLAGIEFGVRAILGLRHNLPTGITHPDGTFAFAIGGADEVGRELSHLSIACDDRVAYATVRGPLEARVYDVGDVVVRRDPLISSGHVVLPDQARHAGLSMNVERLEHVKYVDGSEADVWQRPPRVSLQRDGDAFSFLGQVELGRLRVTATSSGRPMLMPEPIEFTLGATDLVVRVRRGGALQVAWIDEVAQTNTRVSLVPAPGVVPTFARSVPINLAALWPGRYRLEAQVVGDTKPALCIEGVDIVDGETTNLGPLALTSPIRQLVLRIEDLDGARLRHSVVVVHPSRGEKAAVRFAPEGEVVVPTTEPTVDVVVAAAGRRAAQLRIVNDTTIRLAPSTQRTFSLAGGMPALPADVELALEVHAQDTAARLREQHGKEDLACAGLLTQRRATLDANGRGAIEIAQPGSYRVVPVLLTLKAKFSYRIEVTGAAVDLVVAADTFAIADPLTLTLPEPGWRVALARADELRQQ